jgi:hypothetical protein
MRQPKVNADQQGRRGLFGFCFRQCQQPPAVASDHRASKNRIKR